MDEEVEPGEEPPHEVRLVAHGSRAEELVAQLG